MTHTDIKYLDANNAHELLRTHEQTLRHLDVKGRDDEPVWLVSDAQKAHT